MGKGKKRMGTQQQLRANNICAYCREKGHWKRNCPDLSSDQGMFVVKVNMVTNSASWVLDTGCGAHICNDLQVLQRSRKLSKDEVVLRLGDGKAVAAKAVGIINLVVSDRVRLELKDCYFVPSMMKNIISIPLFDNDDFEFLINKNYFYLMKDGSSYLLGKLNNGLYILQWFDWIMTAQNKRKLENLENAQIWHARLGHISQDRMKGLVDSKSLEIDNLDNLPVCDIKMLGDTKAWLSTQFSMKNLAVGRIQYVAQCTRSDIAYALSVMSRYQACAGEAHWTAVKTILKYLRRTNDVFLSSKQDTTADSTTEAEYIAASEATKETVWMKNYIQELDVVPSIAEPVVIFYDNNEAIAQAKEPRSHHKSKHILRRYHLHREMVEEAMFGWTESAQQKIQ
ncbi:UNVERIFIED_CONTAM: Retrovirus-related Pol polyprotein from transposon TNT 1-94 [Sesamum calycinum]|uniref:Retrovirus-related Pol polyprotein from transposon TNT 1-94 n=1 Tax=Sesamum calycinum TaxID=2727403 RepID=A0AAW2IYS3_9LAMI